MMFRNPTARPSDCVSDADPTALRIDLYALLAALLATPPSRETIHSLATLTTLPGLPDALNDTLQCLKKTAGASNAQSVIREYHALFIGMGRGEMLPYASWYRDRQLMSTSLARLRSDLAALNLKRRDTVFESEDHAAALLECMLLIIAEHEGQAPIQREFFAAHIEPWLVRFFNDLQQAPSADFYRCVGRLGSRFMEMELRLLRRGAQTDREKP